MLKINTRKLTNSFSGAAGDAGIANKIDAGKYYLTIDINDWNMEVQVYVS